MAGRGRARAATGTRTRPAAARRARPVANRRRRALFVGAGLFAGAVLATGMPVSALLTQHHQLSETAAALARVQAANQALSVQARHLGDPSTVSGLARTDYGMVPPGDKAYVILPPAGSSAAAIAGSGHVPLDGPPVVPGSPQSQALLGGGVPASSSSAGSRSAAASPHAGAKSGGGFWSRVLHTLEFWH
ncbi:MAG: septum formation initiator family protein [Acidimicrobiales bacterium]